MKKVLITLVVANQLASAVAGEVVVQGKHESPGVEFGGDASYKLAGDTEFGWKTSKVSGDIDLNGHALVMETGGGNRTEFSGVISGRGAVEWRGGGVPQVSPSILSGSRPNTFAGVFTMARGVLDLAKPAGMAAISGDLVIGGKGPAMVRLAQADQIADTARVSFTGGEDVNGWDLQGKHEKVAQLAVGSQVVIHLGGAGAELQVGDSSAATWDLTKTVTVTGYEPGKTKVVIGSNDKGLTKAQLGRIGFDKPAGLAAGLYTAKISARGELQPDAMVRAQEPPFDVGAAAQEARSTIYQTEGLKKLTGKDSPLRDGQTVCFFGDSITWQNGYIGQIENALKQGEGTRGMKVRLVNRGINGGGVLSLRDGSDKAAYPGDSAQKPFAEVIQADKADVVVIFIGINDLWWRNTTPEVFEKALTELAQAGKANKSRVVLATATVRGELPHGKNENDPQIEVFAELTRKVAKATDVTLVDLRRAYVAYLQNHNAQLRVDGSLYFKPAGVLTYDAVHPTAKGNELLADLIGDGIYRALTRK